jgi:hypothetical protein
MNIIAKKIKTVKIWLNVNSMLSFVIEWESLEL